MKKYVNVMIAIIMVVCKKGYRNSQASTNKKNI